MISMCVSMCECLHVREDVTVESMCVGGVYACYSTGACVVICMYSTCVGHCTGECKAEWTQQIGMPAGDVSLGPLNCHCITGKKFKLENP